MGRSTFLELVHFNRVVSSDEALREFDTMGLRPATLPELLAFGAQYPEKRREFPVVALGSTWRRWDGNRNVVYLCWGAGHRSLSLRWLVNRWFSIYRFAAVRKSA